MKKEQIELTANEVKKNPALSYLMAYKHGEVIINHASYSGSGIKFKLIVIDENRKHGDSKKNENNKESFDNWTDGLSD